MAQDRKPDLAALMTEIKNLNTKLDDLKAKVESDRKDPDKESKKELDSEMAAAAALFPLYGLTFASPLLLPFGLRLAAARALVLHRALERAAKITGELAKAPTSSNAQATGKIDLAQIVPLFFSLDQKSQVEATKVLLEAWQGLRDARESDTKGE